MSSHRHLARWQAVVASLCLGLLAACESSSSGSMSPGAPVASESAAAADGSPGGQPDCLRAGYPCSLAETPLKLRERMVELLGGARARLAGEGTIADALAYLRGESDMVEAFGADRAITFRIAGAPPVWLVDHTGVQLGGSSAAPEDADPAGRGVPAFQLASVVGEDTSRDGEIDQRDAKRALVLAPYMWDFAPDDESDLLAERLEAMPGYAGNVHLRPNRNREDRIVTLADYRSFAQYDAIFISSHGARACRADGSQEACETVVSTRVFVDMLETQISGSGARGMAAVSIWDDDDESQQSAPGQSVSVIELGLTPDFLRFAYPGGLDHMLLSLSACETGGIAGDAFAAAAGGDDFVMMAWTEVVPSDASFAASGLLIEQLSLGLTTQQAYAAVIDEGLGSAFTDLDDSDDVEDFIVTTYELISPGKNDVRLVELPTLLIDGAPIQDGTDITRLVTGTAGDNQPDRISIDLRLIGIDDPATFRVRYEVDGQTTPGTYDLASARPSSRPYEYTVTHDVDVGFDVPTGEVPLSVVVELPEGSQSQGVRGESRYSVRTEVRADTAVIVVGGRGYDFTLTSCGWVQGELNAGGVATDGSGVNFAATFPTDFSDWDGREGHHLIVDLVVGPGEVQNWIVAEGPPFHEPDDGRVTDLQVSGDTATGSFQASRNIDGVRQPGLVPGTFVIMCARWLEPPGT